MKLGLDNQINKTKVFQAEKNWLHDHVYFTYKSVKYHSWHFQISRSTDGIDLKFSPVIDLDKICSQTKLQVNIIICCAQSESGS